MFQHFKRLGKQIFIYGLGDTVNKLVAFLLIPFFTKYLSPVDFGVSSILLVLSSLMIGITDLGLTQGIFRFFGEEKNANRKKIISTIQIVTVLLTSLVALFVILFAKGISQLFFKTEIYQYIIILSFITIPFTVLITPVLTRLRIEEKAKTYALLNLAKVMTGVILSVILIIGLKRGINGLFEGQLINALIYAAAIGFYSIKVNGLFFSPQL